MSVNLITGNLFSPIQASQDSDYQAGTFGEKTQILNVGSKMAVSIVDNSTIRCEDGVLVTREGRRVQIDNGDVVEWTIPTGTQGTTSYYIVGFRLYTDDESAQLCDTFVQLVSGPGATITEDTFRDGAVEIFVSVARVVQNGITLESVESLVPLATTLDQAKEDISQINSDLSKAPIDVTNLFSINELGIWWSAIYNPIARTVKLSCYGHGSFLNGSIKFTVPSDYAFNVPDNYIVGALGSVRSSDNAFAFTIAKFITSNNTYQVEVYYSSAIVATELSFSIEYQVAD